MVTGNVTWLSPAACDPCLNAPYVKVWWQITYVPPASTRRTNAAVCSGPRCILSPGHKMQVEQRYDSSLLSPVAGSVVSYMSVTTAAHRPKVTRPDTWRDKKETARRAAFPQRAGRLARLTAAGWLVREDEDIDPAQEGRPRRSTYSLTEQGMAAARRELDLMSEQIALPLPQPWRPRLQHEGGPA